MPRTLLKREVWVTSPQHCPSCRNQPLPRSVKQKLHRSCTSVAGASSERSTGSRDIREEELRSVIKKAKRSPSTQLVQTLQGSRIILQGLQDVQLEQQQLVTTQEQVKQKVNQQLLKQQALARQKGKVQPSQVSSQLSADIARKKAKQQLSEAVTGITTQETATDQQIQLVQEQLQLPIQQPNTNIIEEQQVQPTPQYIQAQPPSLVSPFYPSDRKIKMQVMHGHGQGKETTVGDVSLGPEVNTLDPSDRINKMSSTLKLKEEMIKEKKRRWLRLALKRRKVEEKEEECVEEIKFVKKVLRTIKREAQRDR
eukprot:GFUD01045123.1.p1 GENE.GFUD01045123.1~~GFUD01045123.1.p1  ORF type:complete len:311 (+),score=89.07 GFUD01045123.1:794-1726(+)